MNKSINVEYTFNLPPGHTGQIPADHISSVNFAPYMNELSDTRWLDMLPDVVIITDAEGRIVFSNRACQDTLGWQSEELRGETIEKIIPKRFADHTFLRKQFMTAPSHRFMGNGLELVALHSSGREIPVDISLNPLTVNGQLHILVDLRDISTYQEATRKLRLLSTAVDSAANGVVITNQSGKIVWVNPTTCHMTGYSAEELIGQTPRLWKSNKHDERFYTNMWSTISSGKIWQGEIINRRKDGSEYNEEQTIAPVLNQKGEIINFIAIKLDVTERVRAERLLRETRDELARYVVEIESLQIKLREQAIRDPLTNLFNRRYLDETLIRELAKASRDKTHLCLVMIDLDRFKKVNDIYGHAIGDEVLVKLGKVLGLRSRAGDVACRYGGEEFAVMLLSATLKDGIHIADGWRQNFNKTALRVGSTVVYSTFSAGVAEWTPGETPADLLARADAALYQAKDTGRNHVVGAK